MTGLPRGPRHVLSCGMVAALLVVTVVVVVVLLHAWHQRPGAPAARRSDWSVGYTGSGAAAGDGGGWGDAGGSCGDGGGGGGC